MAINGLMVTLSGLLVKQMCIERATERRHRANLYEQQKKTLSEADIDMGTSSNDVKYRAIENSKQCIKEAQEMEFYAAHLDVNEKYILSSFDLTKLGMIK